MPRASLPAACVLAFVAIATCAESQAGVFFHRRRGTPPPGNPRSIEHTHHRAGHPLDVSHLAQPSNSPAYVGGYVGGGMALGGDARFPEEGTWGWDYTGKHLPRQVFLRWSHGRRNQGGTGSYRTDGPPVPDIIGLTLSGSGRHEGRASSRP